MAGPEKMIAQLDDILMEFQGLRNRAEDEKLSNMDSGALIRFVTRARAVIPRVAGKPSPYVDQCEQVIRMPWYSAQARDLAAVVDSLRADVAAGYLKSQRELVHGELFADFLEMAQHLLDEGYKDPAAVIAGSSLEAHLRQLCQKAGIDLDVTEANDVIQKKADRLNADLTKAEVYSKLDQKNVTAWLDLRNKAAHGDYDKYKAPQVGLLISGIRDFLTRTPA